MPQLITIPYHHTYVSIVLLLGSSFLLFCKYFLPVLLRITKLILNNTIKTTKTTMFIISYSSKQKNITNIHNKKMFDKYLLSNIIAFQIIWCIYIEYLQQLSINYYENNNIFSNLI